MLKKRFCAGVVLFNPDTELLKKNLDALETQVERIFLFDNGSNNVVDISNLLSTYNNVSCVRSDENKGIAYALNQLLDEADKNDFEWILTMDQDSICSDNMIDEYSKYTFSPDVALLCPFVLNNGKYTLETYQKLKLRPYDDIKYPIDCITSGCLTNVPIVKKIGGYLSFLFIDGVDTELNCRVLESGHKIRRVNAAYLIQQMGKAKKIKSLELLYKITKLNLFRRIQTAAVYNDIRLYYFARNNYIIHKKHKNAGFRTSPIFMTMLFLYFSVFFPISRNRIDMWKSITRGYRDAVKYV